MGWGETELDTVTFNRMPGVEKGKIMLRNKILAVKETCFSLLKLAACDSIFLDIEIHH